MICEYQSLYYGDDGYIVRCRQCGHYQVAFISTMLMLNADDFDILRHIVGAKMQEKNSTVPGTKTVVIRTPSKEVSILLTRAELEQLHRILEEADNELKTQELIRLFGA
ncbi:MAG TPA: hypothetical protein PKC39_06165 [Ferruginibacter sp.]|nr:hypothetical protein [Ferruginibacter sp.]HMP20527.1 hypothetical protein [Ferruginibacter sp.]